LPSIVLKVVERRPSSSVDLTSIGVVTGMIAYVRSPSAILPMATDRSLRQLSSRLVMRSLSSRTGRTTERVTQTASPIAIRMATIATMSIMRVPLACVASACLTAFAALAFVPAVSLAAEASISSSSGSSWRS
jgi:hypothetical protein